MLLANIMQRAQLLTIYRYVCILNGDLFIVANTESVHHHQRKSEPLLAFVEQEDARPAAHEEDMMMTTTTILCDCRFYTLDKTTVMVYFTRLGAPFTVCSGSLSDVEAAWREPTDSLRGTPDLGCSETKTKDVTADSRDFLYKKNTPTYMLHFKICSTKIVLMHIYIATTSQFV